MVIDFLSPDSSWVFVFLSAQLFVQLSILFVLISLARR